MADGSVRNSCGSAFHLLCAEPSRRLPCFLKPVVIGGTPEGRGVVAAGSRGRLQNGLIIAEIALALMLLTGAGLLVRSFTKLMSVSPGFVAGLLPTPLEQRTDR